MPDSKTEIHDVDPAEWRSNLEYKLKHEFCNCSMSDRIAFIKKMTNSLKLTLDDIRGVNKSDKYSALNSIPPDVLPIKIQLVDGEAIILLEVNPVITIYDDLLTNVRGDIVHLHIRRKGEEHPEDFIPPKKLLTIRPPPPGFFRTPLEKLFSEETSKENYVPQSKPSTSKENYVLQSVPSSSKELDEKPEDEVTLGVNEDVYTSDKKIQEDPSLPKGQGIDQTNPDESVSDIIYDEDILTDKESTNDSVINISDESSNHSNTTIIVNDSSSSSSTENTTGFRVLGVTVLEEPEVDQEWEWNM